MFVSNFTLGYNYPFAYGVDEWMKAYELQITNLATVPIVFGIEARITDISLLVSTGESVAYMLNQFLRWDFSRDDNGYYTYNECMIDANGSFTFNLYPGITFQRDWTPYVDGYTTLRVPVVPGPKPSGPKVPQSTKPIPVLLRAGGLQQWYREEEPGSHLVTSSESNPQLATGTAYNEIPPDTSPFFRPIGLKQYIQEIANVHKISGIKAGAPSAAQDVPAKPVVSQNERLLQRPARAVAPPEDSRAAALIDLLSNLATDKEEIDALNEILRDRGLGITVKRDKG